MENLSRFGSEYIPLVSETSTRLRLLIPFSRIAWFTVSLPFLGFVFCVCWSILYNFKEANFTHCEVYNFLPSISAAIGHYKPQSDVWKAAIAIQAHTRVLVLIMYYRHYKETVYKWAQFVSRIALAAYAIENTALVTLSFWSSHDNYALHKLSFITFLIMSLLHMSLSCMITRSCRSPAKDAVEASSFKWKWRMLFANVSSILLACYFFYRHNKYCEANVYSLFAMSEYMVVLTNMGFHMTAAWDFAGRKFLISLKGLRII
ncbi:post-GPI attachment to proteins factor 2 [Diprion similis]|uniref:post-GPI attachment to proteins factor 2 n=1 Tax=Diprion similis TaxID=362088 RepID=UPI001EF8EE42|nr:post-GPI attachment to proteins factor 2 [Diprion similis]